jgi:CcmD family protein
MNLKSILPAVFSFIPVISLANGSQPEMAEGLYESGKIYVVIVVGLIILSGIFLYLVMLDRKLRGLEKRLDQKK